MITKTESHYPYSRIESDTPIQLRLSESLLDILPHGSGIDYTWHISHAKHNPNRFYASNGFHAMNENGMYCHSYDFTLTIDYIPENERKVDCQYCNGRGYRYVMELLPYHISKTEETLTTWLEERFKNKAVIDDTGHPTFECNICNGEGYTVRHPFDLIRLNFHGQREYTCCGYGLKDYIYQLINDDLSFVKVG